MTANSHLITYTGKKIMRRLTALAKHQKVDYIQESTDIKRGYNLFGHASTHSLQSQEISIEFLNTLLEYIRTWAKMYGKVFLKSYDSLIKDKVSFPVDQPKEGKRPDLQSKSANIASLQEDMATCIEAAHSLKEILSTGSNTKNRKVKSLAKRVQAYKNQIEAQIETGLGGEFNEDGLNALLYANDALGDAIKTYEAGKSKVNRSPTASQLIPKSAKALKIRSVRKSQDLSQITDIKKLNNAPVSKLSKKKPPFMPTLGSIPSEILQTGPNPQGAIPSEPVPKPTPDPPSNNSSILEDGCRSPISSLSSPMRFETSTFSQSIKFVSIIQQFSLEDRQFLDTPDSSTTARNQEETQQEYLQKMNEMTSMLKNQEKALELQTRKLANKSEMIKELKKTKYELDAYITSINSKYEKLKEFSVNQEKDQECISTFKQLIKQKESRIDENINQIKDMEDYIEDMKKLIVSKETEIIQKNDQISEFELYMEKINSLVETKETKIEQLNSVIKIKDQFIEDMKDELDGKLSLMRELSEELSNKEDTNQDLLNKLEIQSDKIIYYKKKTLILKEKLKEKSQCLDNARHSLNIESLEDIQTHRKTANLQTHRNRTVPSTPQHESSIFLNYLENIKPLVDNSSGYLKPPRRYTISPAAIAYGDSESAEMNESDMSHSDQSVEISPEIETKTNKEKLEITLEIEETPTFDLPLRRSTNTELNRASFVSVYMEEPSIMHECSITNSFKSPESAEGITESPFLFSHSVESDIKPDNLEMYRFCVNRLKGVLYSNDFIEIGIQVDHEQGNGIAHLCIGNKSDYPIDNLESRVINRDTVNLDVEINYEVELKTLEKMEKLERLISFQIQGELKEPPLLLVKYLSNNTLYRVSLVLPITIALCFELFNLDPTQIMQEWTQSKEYEKIREFEGLNEYVKSMRELAWFLHMGGGVRIFSYREVKNLSKRSIIFACLYKGEKVLYMVNLNESATGGEIYLRTENCKLQESIMPLLINLVSL